MSGMQQLQKRLFIYESQELNPGREMSRNLQFSAMLIDSSGSLYTPVILVLCSHRELFDPRWDHPDLEVVQQNFAKCFAMCNHWTTINARHLTSNGAFSHTGSPLNHLLKHVFSLSKLLFIYFAHFLLRWSCLFKYILNTFTPYINSSMHPLLVFKMCVPLHSFSKCNIHLLIRFFSSCSLVPVCQAPAGNI